MKFYNSRNSTNTLHIMNEYTYLKSLLFDLHMQIHKFMQYNIFYSSYGNEILKTKRQTVHN
jgi:hypothetical protein